MTDKKDERFELLERLTAYEAQTEDLKNQLDVLEEKYKDAVSLECEARSRLVELLGLNDYSEDD